MKIVSVLRSGPDWLPGHAMRLHAQLPPDAVCMTDLPGIEGVNTVPLTQPEWQGWWSKMELFNPDGPLGGDDLFYMDIDTTIVGDIRPILDAVSDLPDIVMLSDFYRPEHLASGIMFIPQRIKQRVWSAWIKNPYWFMVRRRLHGRLGDQGFISQHIARAHRWDELCPGKIVSYKKHVVAPGDIGHCRQQSIGDGTVPADAAIVCFHGEPRPWSVGELCKPLSSGITSESRGSNECKPRLSDRLLSLTTGTEGRSKGTGGRSKSRKRRGNAV